MEKSNSKQLCKRWIIQQARLQRSAGVRSGHGQKRDGLPDRSSPGSPPRILKNTWVSDNYALDAYFCEQKRHSPYGTIPLLIPAEQRRVCPGAASPQECPPRESVHWRQPLNSKSHRQHQPRSPIFLPLFAPGGMPPWGNPPVGVCTRGRHQKPYKSLFLLLHLDSTGSIYLGGFLLEEVF